MRSALCDSLLYRTDVIRGAVNHYFILFFSLFGGAEYVVGTFDTSSARLYCLFEKKSPTPFECVCVCVCEGAFCPVALVYLQLCSVWLPVPWQVEQHAALGFCSDVVNHKSVPTSKKRQRKWILPPIRLSGIHSTRGCTPATTQPLFYYNHTDSIAQPNINI